MSFRIFLIVDDLSFCVFDLELSTRSEKEFKVWSFLAFRCKAIIWGHILLDFVFSATFRK